MKGDFRQNVYQQVLSTTGLCCTHTYDNWLCLQSVKFNTLIYAEGITVISINGGCQYSMYAKNTKKPHPYMHSICSGQYPPLPLMHPKAIKLWTYSYLNCLTIRSWTCPLQIPQLVRKILHSIDNEVWHLLILKCDTQNKTFKVTWTVLFSPFVPLSMHTFLLKLAIYYLAFWIHTHLSSPPHMQSVYIGLDPLPPCVHTTWTAPLGCFFISTGVLELTNILVTDYKRSLDAYMIKQKTPLQPITPSPKTQQQQKERKKKHPYSLWDISDLYL